MKRWVIVLLVLASPTIVMGVNRESGATMALLTAMGLLAVLLLVLRFWKTPG